MRCRSRRRTGPGWRTGGCRRRRRAAGRRRRGRCRAAPAGWSRGRSTRAVSSFSRALIFLSIASSSADQLGGEPAAGLAGQVARPDGREQRAGLRRGQELLRPAGQQFQQQPVQPVDGLGAGPAELVAAVGQHAHHHQVLLDLRPGPGPGRAARPARPSARRPGRSCGRCRWRTPAPARTASRGTSSTVSPSCDQPVRDVPADAVAALDRPDPVRELPRRGRASAHTRPCPCRTGPPPAPLARSSMTSIVAERLCGSIPMITPIGLLLAQPVNAPARRAPLLRAGQTPFEPLLARCPARTQAMREPHQ